MGKGQGCVQHVQGCAQQQKVLFLVFFLLLQMHALACGDVPLRSKFQKLSHSSPGQHIAATHKQERTIVISTVNKFYEAGGV